VKQLNGVCIVKYIEGVKIVIPKNSKKENILNSRGNIMLVNQSGVVFSKQFPSPHLRKNMSDLQIIYATVTGCAQGVAEDVAKKAAAQGWNPTCCAIDKVDMDMFAKQKAALFIVSTTGDGDTPDCARTFLRHLRKNKDNTQLLAAVNYSVRAALTQHSSQRQRARF
jgi:sulfite reductase alpha subunit-like flavoprotein